MKKHLLLVAACTSLAACTSGNSAIEPPFQSANPTLYKLEFAVGTANYQLVDPATGTIIPTVGLNTVETYRQPNGLSGSLANSPTIIGPAGFRVPAGAGSAGVDAGKGSITSIPQSVQVGDSTPTTTFGQSGGVFAYGFLPVNSTNQATSGNNGYTPYGQPFYTDSVTSDGSDGSSVYLGGPPAYTNVRTGTYPSGFIGYTQGFNSFANTTLAGGNYTLNVVVPTSPTTNGTLTAVAALTRVAPLPAYAPPTVVEDGAGGAAITLIVPAGVTETLVDIVDGGPPGTPPAGVVPVACHGAYDAPYDYTVVDHTVGPATARVTLPPNVGPVSPTTNAATPTLCFGDQYTVTAVGADYRAYESGPGQPNANGLSETPAILNPGGTQADITVSAPGGPPGANGLYGSSAVRASVARAQFKNLTRVLHINTYHPHSRRK